MKKNCTLLLIIIFTFLFSPHVFAADFFTTTAKTQVSIDDTFDIYVNINSAGDIINSGEGNMSFPSDLLSVVSINNSSSIFSIWPEKPVFSNQNGTISFNGGLPNPGFSGSKGVVVKITFKAKSAGVAPISIASGSIYSNDGTGTDVLKAKRGITITINQSAVKKVVEDINTLTKDEVVKPVVNNLQKDKTTGTLPPMPNVSSRDVADLNNWATQKDILLEWDIPKGVDAVQFSVDSNEVSVPNILKIPPLNNTKLINMANGVSNFHIRFRNANGWGQILHKKIKVDIINPEIVSADQFTNDQGLISLNIKAMDVHSGIDKVKVQIDKKDLSESKAESDKILKVDLPLLETGDNTISVIVYDNAGNFSEREIVVNHPKPAQPLISIDRKEALLGKDGQITIETYPNTEISLFIKGGNSETEKVLLKTDSSGIVKYDLSNIKTVGEKNIWVSLNNNCKEICVFSERVSVNISEKKLINLNGLYLQKIKDFSNENSSLPWMISFILFVLYIISLIKNKNNRNKNLIQELNKAEVDVYKIFKVLKTDARRYKTMLKRNKIDLIDKDKQIIENLEQDLDEAETYFAKRIEKIENELEL